MRFKFNSTELGSFAYDMYRYIGEGAEATVEVDEATYLKMLDGIIDNGNDKQGIAKIVKIMVEQGEYKGNDANNA